MQRKQLFIRFLTTAAITVILISIPATVVCMVLNLSDSLIGAISTGIIVSLMICSVGIVVGGAIFYIRYCVLPGKAWVQLATGVFSIVVSFIVYPLFCYLVIGACKSMSDGSVLALSFLIALTLPLAVFITMFFGSGSWLRWFKD